MANLEVKSPAFEKNGMIPTKYTCEGEDINPPLTISGIPDAAKTLALTIEDPGAPSGTFDHWVVWNIPTNGKIKENMSSGTQGKNGANQVGYTGMCPPSGTHKYIFTVYALDTKLELDENAHKKDLKKAIQGHILAEGQLIAYYKKS
jgi:Raf kinase inhibitor-like YbhB/YbcL family protein